MVVLLSVAHMFVNFASKAWKKGKINYLVCIYFDFFQYYTDRVLSKVYECCRRRSENLVVNTERSGSGSC